MVEVKGLGKHFTIDSGQVTALQDLDLRMESGERLGVFGPSGCGKTTLLRCLAGLETPNSGTIRIGGVEVFNKANGTDVPPWARPIGFVFQDFALWPNMSVLDNVLFPLIHGRANSLTRSECREVACEALRRVRLDGLHQRLPSELSGGQRQRVALARAIAARPTLLLMDEPLSNLDPQLREHTRNELIAILEEAGITTIFVSHEHRDTHLIADTIGIMRSGRLIQKGSSSEVASNPLDATAAEILTCGFLILCRKSIGAEPGLVRYEVSGADQSVELRDDNSREVPTQAALLFPRNGFRLRGNSMSASESMLFARVVRVGYVVNLGWCILAKIGDAHVEAWESERPDVQRDDRIELIFDRERVRVLPRLVG